MKNFSALKPPAWQAFLYGFDLRPTSAVNDSLAGEGSNMFYAAFDMLFYNMLSP